MSSPLELAEARILRQRQITEELKGKARKLWKRVDRRNIAASWLGIIRELMVLFTAAQLASAEGAEEYIGSVLAAQGVSVTPEGRFVPQSLQGVASDGRPLESLVYQPAIASLTAIQSGVPVGQSLAVGQALLDTIVMTQLADVGRAAIGIGTAQRRGLGYIRHVQGKTCGRCVVLAGRWYRYNASFDRHPRCDCFGVPCRESVAGDLATDPKAFFNSMSKEEQNRQFTVAGARAIREGADIGRVVNARRGAFGLAPASGRLTAAERASLSTGRLQTQRVFGRDLYLTAEATTKRGINRKVRLMPESIYSLAVDREDALRLLRVHGYLI